MKRIVSPSILSADFGNLERDIRMIDRSAAEWVHVDVMDGVFVPNISFGFPVMKPLRRATRKVLDVHLMITEPERYLRRFVEAGADFVTFHHEATRDARGCIAAIREAGAKASNAGEVFAAGADAVVAGSAVFGAADPEAEIRKILEAR